jgi:hypothetical protein
MNTYPESLINRCTYLEKVNRNLRETVIRNDQYIESLREDIKRLNELLEDNETQNRIWVFNNDGYDNIASMCNDLPVLIKACDLRDILLRGETVYSDQP